MIREELNIPAITTLKSTDATAIRAIVASLTKEIYNLRLEIDALKEERERMAYRNVMTPRRR